MSLPCRIWLRTGPRRLFHRLCWFRRDRYRRCYISPDSGNHWTENRIWFRPPRDLQHIDRRRMCRGPCRRYRIGCHTLCHSACSIRLRTFRRHHRLPHSGSRWRRSRTPYQRMHDCPGRHRSHMYRDLCTMCWRCYRNWFRLVCWFHYHTHLGRCMSQRSCIGPMLCHKPLNRMHD